MFMEIPRSIPFYVMSLSMMSPPSKPTKNMTLIQKLSPATSQVRVRVRPRAGFRVKIRVRVRVRVSLSPATSRASARSSWGHKEEEG